MLKILLFIGSGSFIGGVARYLLSVSIQKKILSSFPYGTLIVNIAGCLLLGIVFALFEEKAILNHEWKMFLTVGFCGGFTTFSTFTLENLLLLKDSNYLHFFLYTITSVVLCLVFLYLGYMAIKLLQT